MIDDDHYRAEGEALEKEWGENFYINYNDDDCNDDADGDDDHDHNHDNFQGRR